MNVTTRNTDELNAVLTVEIKPEDYKEKVEKTLKDYRKNAKIPGFRPGHIPSSLIKKQYGKAVLIEEVNHILQHAVYDHIKKEDLDILGNPIPVPQNDINWDAQDEFAFEFELGLAPTFDLTLNKKVKVNYYKIVADDKMIDRYVDDYAKRFGTMTYPQDVTATAIVKAKFVEKADEGIVAEGSFSMESVKEKKTISALTGMKIGETLDVKLKKMFNDEFNVPGLLNISSEEYEASSGDFNIEVMEISELNAAPLDQELFDKVFGKDNTVGEDAFRNKIKEDAERMFISESERKFYQDVRETVMGKVKFELPDEFLKKWMQNAGEKPMSEEEVDQQYPEMKDSMKWQLVENKVIKDNSIEVGQEELIDFTKGMIRNQMMQYGQDPDQMDLDPIAQNVLQNKEEVQRITDQLFSEKLIAFFKESIKLNEKEVTFDEFLKANK